VQERCLAIRRVVVTMADHHELSLGHAGTYVAGLRSDTPPTNYRDC
jgi:hypothetical protein